MLPGTTHIPRTLHPPSRCALVCTPTTYILHLTSCILHLTHTTHLPYTLQPTWCAPLFTLGMLLSTTYILHASLSPSQASAHPTTCVLHLTYLDSPHHTYLTLPYVLHTCILTHLTSLTTLPSPHCPASPCTSPHLPPTYLPYPTL